MAEFDSFILLMTAMVLIVAGSISIYNVQSKQTDTTTNTYYATIASLICGIFTFLYSIFAVSH